MKNILLLIISLMGFIPIFSPLQAQSGMTFEEFRERLQPYYADELIGDVKKQLPLGTSYRIWGWDVGDFSGDGNNDVALSIKTAEKGKTVNVYLFVDIDGYLTNVGKYDYQYVELPLEVGVVIKQNGCFVMKKQKQFFWTITGYRFDNGAVILLDEFKTEKLDAATRETYRNFQTLESYEKYRNTRTGDVTFSSEYLTIPSYPRGTYVYKGLTADAVSASVQYVTKGAYYWSGEADCSFRTRSVHTNEFLYFSLSVNDDAVVAERDSAMQGDRVELWFDAENFSNRLLKQDAKFRTSADSGLYCFSVHLGNFLDKKPIVRVSSTDELDESQRLAISQVKAVATLTNSGYVVKVRIPFRVFGYESAPMEEGKSTDFGFSAVVYDIDNEFRPEEESLIATSRFQRLNPASLGLLTVLSNKQVYGESVNIYADPVAERLKELGY